MALVTEKKKIKIKKTKHKKFITKPKAKGPAPISARKTLKSFANDSGPMVREVEPKELVKDERSLYFKKEYEKEKTETGKWLS